MNSIQAWADGMSAQWQRERAETQMTLGKLIETLSAMPPETVVNLGDPDSYRGYYSDLALDTVPGRTAAELLAECRDAMGKEFTGYKGGEYIMGVRTPVWLASYGCCGLKLMALNPDGSVETAEDD